MPYPRLSSALILVTTSSPSRGGDAIKSGNVEEVSKRLRQCSGGNIDVIHWLLGPADMIVHVHASNLDELLKIIADSILPLKSERFNYIGSTETLIVTDSRAKQPLSELGERPAKPTAWVLANSNTGNPETGFNLLQHKNVIYVAHVIGRYDVILLLESETLQELAYTIDKTLRPANFLVNTDTRIVLM